MVDTLAWSKKPPTNGAREVARRLHKKGSPFTMTGTFTVPAGIASVELEVWGGWDDDSVVHRYDVPSA